MDDLSSAVAPSLAILREAIEGFTAHAFATIDVDGRITSWSRGAERLFGHPREHAIGQHLSLIFAAQERDTGVPDQVLADARRHGAVSSDRWLIRRDGVPRYLNATIVACRDESGGVTYVALAHDTIS